MKLEANIFQSIEEKSRMLEKSNPMDTKTKRASMISLNSEIVAYFTR